MGEGQEGSPALVHGACSATWERPPGALQTPAAALLICCAYDSPGFQVVERSTNHDGAKATMDASVERGVAVWQANFRFAPGGVTQRRVMPVTL